MHAVTKKLRIKSNKTRVRRGQEINMWHIQCIRVDSWVVLLMQKQDTNRDKSVLISDSIVK